MFSRLNQGRIRSAGALVVGLLCIFVASQAKATLMEIFSTPALFARADVIASVRVGEGRSLRHGPNQFIYTDTQIRLEEVWQAGGAAVSLKKGAALDLRQIGGRLGDVEHSVVGTAPIRSGDKLIIFARFQGGRLYLVGMGQGAFLLLGDSLNPAARSMFGARPKAAASLGEKGLTRDELRATVLRLSSQARSGK